MTTLSNTRDLTGRMRMAEPSPPMLLLFMCGHKGVRTGSRLRGNLPMQCAACVAKKAAA